MKEFSSYLDKKLKDPVFRKEFFRIHYLDDLADQILMLRAKRGYSQDKLAELANTTQAVVSRVENGSVNSSLKMVQKLAEALSATIKVEIIPDEEMIYQEFYLNCLFSFDNEIPRVNEEKQQETLIEPNILKASMVCMGEVSSTGKGQWAEIDLFESAMA